MVERTHPQRLPEIKLSPGSRRAWMLGQLAAMLFMNIPVWQVLEGDDWLSVALTWLAISASLTWIATAMLVAFWQFMRRHVDLPRFPKVHCPRRLGLVIWATLIFYFFNPSWDGFWLWLVPFLLAARPA